MLKKIAILALLFLSGQIAFAQDTLLTMEKAIGIMLKNNFSITIATNETEIAKNNNNCSRTGKFAMRARRHEGILASSRIAERRIFRSP